MYNSISLQLAVICVLFHSTSPLLHPSSPCPSVFSYEGSEPETDRWYGEIVISSRDVLVGVRLNIQLDRRLHVMVSWLGDVTTEDNKEFTILNLDQRLDPHRPLTTRVMVRFDPSGGSPKVKTILLNGKQICPGEPPIQVNALNKNSSKPSSNGLKRPDPIFITDTVYNPSITTYDDYYSEFFNINQQNANKRNPDKVYANTESSVPETGYGKPHKTGQKGAQKPVQNTDSSYPNSQSNTDYTKPSEHNSYSNSNQGGDHVSVVQSNKKKTNEDPEYVQPKPQQTYKDTDEYGNYNPRPQTGATNYNRPQSSDTTFNARPQTNSESNYNARPQSSSDTSYNTRPQATYENNFDTNSRPETSGTNSFGTGSNPNNYNGASSSGSSYNPGSSSSNVHTSVSRPQTIPGSDNYNPKRQTSHGDTYRPEENAESGYAPQSNSGSSYNPNTGYSGSQATVHNGYSTVNSNSRPASNAGQNSQSENGDFSDIAEHLIEDGDANKTVIITVIKHNPQESTTEAYKPTTSSNKHKTTSKPNNNQNDKTSGNTQGQPLNTQHSQKRPTELGNKKPGANTGSNGQSSNSNKNVECGSVVYNKAQPLVTNGQKTARGQWPWHAALYKTEGINLSYICGGSLVSPNYVITAAHCVTKKPYDKPVDSDTLVIYLGKYHQHQFSDEGGVQNKQVKRIYVYPSYNSSNYLGDVALLRLSSEVDYSIYVRPVCLWDDSTSPLQLSAVEGLDGTVIGWGYDENNRVTEELKMAQMPVVSNEQCLWSYPQFFSQFTSDVTYCAGFRNGTSVCNGDSGGGMVFKMESTWYLRGIVSITVARDGLRICDTKHYVVFTDVAKYLAWVRPIISSN